MLKRLGALALLLLLLIPTAVFPSGDGDIPEAPPEKYYEPKHHGMPGGDEMTLPEVGPEEIPELNLNLLWSLLLQSLSLLP